MVLSHKRLQPPHSVWHRLSVIWLLSHGALHCQEQDTIVWQLATLKVLPPRDAMGSWIPGEIVELDTSLAGAV